MFHRNQRHHGLNCTRLQLTNISLLSPSHSDKLVLSTEIIMADPDGFEEQEGSEETAAVAMALCHLGPSSSELLQTENAFSSISLQHLANGSEDSWLPRKGPEQPHTHSIMVLQHSDLKTLEVWVFYSNNNPQTLQQVLIGCGRTFLFDYWTWTN